MVDYLLVEMEMGRIIQQHVEGTNDKSASENRANSQGELAARPSCEQPRRNQLHDSRCEKPRRIKLHDHRRVYRHCQKKHVNKLINF